MYKVSSTTSSPDPWMPTFEKESAHTDVRPLGLWLPRPLMAAVSRVSHCRAQLRHSHAETGYTDEQLQWAWNKGRRVVRTAIDGHAF
jgi:hypothetical protein